jgi:predicted aldo/keto reductase-like oxidoreductase
MEGSIMNRRDFLKSAALIAGGLLSQGFVLNKAGEPELLNNTAGKVTRSRFKDITLPLLTLGTTRLPVDANNQYGIDQKLLQRIVDYSMEHGVNFFDTAYFYMNGNAETVIGQALKKYARDKFYIADKLPVRIMESKTDNERIFSEQLKKTGMDFFDFYFAHSLNKSDYKNKFKKFNSYDFLQKKKKEGKIKYLGFSFHDDAQELEPIVKEYEWDFVMIQLNYLDWDIINAKLAYETLQKYNMPVWVMNPVKGGNLAEEGLGEKASKILKSVAPKFSIASWAIRFAASLPGVVTVLSGMSNMKQLEDNVKTMTDFKPLSDKERKAIDETLSVYRGFATIPCTYCKYCVPHCPVNIDIPSNLAIYNQYQVDKIDKRDSLFTRNYGILAESKRAGKCINCNACLPYCPQKINIPKELRAVNNLFQTLSVKAK